MAKEVVVRLWDDIDNTQPAIYEDIQLGWDGQIYLLDLSDSSFNGLKEALAPYIAAAHKAVKWPKATQPKKVPAKAAAKAIAESKETPAIRQLSRAERKDARAYLREHGWDIADRGSIPHDGIAAFLESIGEGNQSA